MSRDYDRRRGGSGSGTSSSKLRMDTNVSQPRPHGENSGKRRELDSVMRKARESQSSYWNKKLLEVEERDPNRWRHSGYKELYVGGTTSGEPSRGHPRSPRSPRPRSPHIQRPRSPRTRSPRSPLINHIQEEDLHVVQVQEVLVLIDHVVFVHQKNDDALLNLLVRVQDH